MYYNGQIVHNKETQTPEKMDCDSGSPWCWNENKLKLDTTPYYLVATGKIWGGLDSNVFEAYHMWRSGVLKAGQ